jgi:hypothetical protein
MTTVGFVWSYNEYKIDPTSGGLLTPFVFANIGLAWFLVTRFRVWWNHK